MLTGEVMLSVLCVYLFPNEMQMITRPNVILLNDRFRLCLIQMGKPNLGISFNQCLSTGWVVTLLPTALSLVEMDIYILPVYWKQKVQVAIQVAMYSLFKSSPIIMQPFILLNSDKF